MRRLAALCLVAVMSAAIVVPAAAASGLNAVTLGHRALSTGGIRTRRLRRLESQPRVAGYGVVLDPAPLMRRASRLIAARSGLAAANARAVLAHQQERRAAYLYRAHRNIAQAGLQRARSTLAIAQARRATAAATLAQVRLHMLSQWGPKLTAAARSGGPPLPALQRGAAAIVQISLPLGEQLGHPPAIAWATCPDGAKVRLRFLSRAPHTAGGVGGMGFFYLMGAQTSAPIGTPLTVTLVTSAAQPGVRVPRSAVVWHHGEPWVFREMHPGAFVPVLISNAFIADGGYFLPERAGTQLHAGDRIVTAGTALVYSAAVQTVSSTRAAKAAKADDAHD